MTTDSEARLQFITPAAPTQTVAWTGVIHILEYHACHSLELLRVLAKGLFRLL
jgi:hypothetical protein